MNTKDIKQEIEDFRFGNIEVNFKKYESKKNGKPLYLTALEYSLLHFFVKNKNKVLSRDMILDNIWGEDVYVTHRTVDTHVANLRKKLEDDPGSPKLIIGVRGVGYKFTN